MTGSVALDVVIGLVFIYLLYSLLASIIQEIIANMLGLRARNLRHAITRMLEDEPDNRSSDIINRTFSDSKQQLKRNFQTTEKGLLKEFYDQPVIKYLASGHYFSKPSYISGSDFTKAVFEILKEKGGDNTANIDRIKLALADENSVIPDETRKHLVSLLDDAQNDLVKFKLNLEDWFNNTMERATGWYKRTVQFILITIGFILAISFNVNTIEVVELLSDDKEARDHMVKLASTYASENKELVDLYKIDKLTTATDSVKIDFNTKLDSLLKIKGILESDIDDVSKILGFRPIETLPVKGKRIDSLKVDSLKKTLPSKQKIIGNKYIVEFPSSFLADKTAKYYYIKEGSDKENKVPYAEFYDLYYIYDNFWGYLITALAISLGAPFWFDLLSKLIRIRSSIQNNPKSTSEKNSTQLGTAPVNQRVG